LLEVTDISTGYDDVLVVERVSLTVEARDVVSLIGANGAGKTTTLRAISGLLPLLHGDIKFDGVSIRDCRPHEIVARGIAHVPEGRQLFTNLTIEENLALGAFLPSARLAMQRSLDFVYELFPRLKERRRQIAGTLSGGEQQMLAIGRGLMLWPRLLILDEPSLGLAPLLVARIFATVDRIHAEGMAVLLVEQNLVQSLKHSQRSYVLETGKVVLSGRSGELLKDPRTRQAYLGLAEPTNSPESPEAQHMSKGGTQ
jgi:branched-chain amino acid transport system ATP-binding protein